MDYTKKLVISRSKATRNPYNDPNLSHKDLKKVLIFASVSFLLLLTYMVIWTIVYSIYDCLTILGLAFVGLVPSVVYLISTLLFKLAITSSP